MYENPIRHDATRRREQLERVARNSFGRPPARRRLPALFRHLRSFPARIKRFFPIRVSFGACCDPGDRIESPS